MCYAIPGKVKRIEDKFLIVDYFGEERKAHNELSQIKVGDYIYAQGGFAIRRIPHNEAQEILSTWREIFFDLQKVDLALSRLNQERKDIDSRVLSILDKVNYEIKPQKEELLYLLSITQEKELDFILKSANFLRQKYHKNACCVHGIIEISNTCSRNCAYCGISTHNTGLRRYRMSKDEIFCAAQEAIEKHGFKALVLQGAQDLNYNFKDLANVIQCIKNELGALVIISFGEIGPHALERLYKAGARGLLLRFETSNPQIYEKLHPGYTLKDRIQEIKQAYELGYLLATGGLIGLPGQSYQDILNDLYLAKELNAEMFSFGPFLPHPATPLENLKPVIEEEMLKVLALARFVDPQNAKILVTTAFETLSPNACREGLLSGANSVMLNATPFKYRELYSIYPDRAHQSEEVGEQIDKTITLLKQLGRAPTDLGVRA
ncbi:MAG: [FeFe] hydrogenase H-cluster radical SAM maturase HydE [Candidatus Omnitrophota bacterium]|nr:MAG: [FeFe] hydrogenase H-cluster radical SAM maturase HydE [Candidatus Omnitrophota bacterium]